MIPNFTFSSADLRTDETSALVEVIQPRKGPGVLLSLFGYNSGVLRYLMLFDHDDTAKLSGSITDTDNATGDITDVGHGLHTGQSVIFAGIVGLTTGFVFVVSSSVFRVYDTRANAAAGGETGLLTPANNDDTGTWTLIAMHSFAIGETDNFSVIVPRTGINFSFGLVVAPSSTIPTYTPTGANELTMCGTLLA